MLFDAKLCQAFDAKVSKLFLISDSLWKLKCLTLKFYSTKFCICLLNLGLKVLWIHLNVKKLSSSKSKICVSIQSGKCLNFFMFFKENSFVVKSSFFLFLIASTVCTLAYDKNPLLNLSQINDCLHGLILCSWMDIITNRFTYKQNCIIRVKICSIIFAGNFGVLLTFTNDQFRLFYDFLLEAS